MEKVLVYAISCCATFLLIVTEAKGKNAICQALVDSCSEVGSPLINTLSRPLRGPAGKIGPKGDKGDVGVPGPPGRVNQGELEALVGAKVDAANNDLQETVDQLQSQVRSLWKSNEQLERNRTESNAEFRKAIVNLRNEVRELQLQVRTLNSSAVKIEIEEEAEDVPNRCRGFTYQNKCFFIAAKTSGSITFNTAKTMCTQRGAKLADIYNLNHENMVQDLMRKSMTARPKKLWLAMTIKIEFIGPPPPFPIMLVVLSSGKTMQLSAFRWNRQNPTFQQAHTNILIEAATTPGNHGLMNHLPTYSGSSGALCAK